MTPPHDDLVQCATCGTMKHIPTGMVCARCLSAPASAPPEGIALASELALQDYDLKTLRAQLSAALQERDEFARLYKTGVELLKRIAARAEAAEAERDALQRREAALRERQERIDVVRAELSELLVRWRNLGDHSSADRVQNILRGYPSWAALASPAPLQE